ncbi:glycosyl transferase group 1 [Caldicellulosiruptor hydrothermalis 108]|uniref:Glycosyl transferase group 1 n=1 Tax=Caldicellulosiruptor hydrothermalis (strain DSM 18901 / VKM B-2411 / 108) TaxID=632292 RepID=E4Q8G7_CALH1|nr:glycosyltransferase family 4 protein [Caldicellulosiruptor hydrothermalis]ADQ06812.1 glycosyl transferase group 1 [Caldicellulosiruptor hydrothermalis 108]
MIKICHVTPHMGGGVGRVISGLVRLTADKIQHKIILLEQPQKWNFINSAFEAGAKISISPDSSKIGNLLSESDIVVIHWWHHPKISKFLYNLPEVPLRIIIWTHINNLTVPALNPNFLLEATRVIFSTEASYEAKVFEGIPPDILEKKTGVVYGCPGIDDFVNIKKKEHDGFNVGYIGLVDFSKLHPNFVEFCSAVKLNKAKFILVGDAPVREYIEKKGEEKGLKGKFIFTGYVNDVKTVLSEIDVLGYPLIPYHTFAAENSIIEAMAAGIPPVLLNQLVERYIIKDGETGILVNSVEEYGQAIRYLYNNPDKREEMGKKAQEYVLKKYTAKNFVESFIKNCELTMEESKKLVNFKKYLGNTPAEWFMSCLGKDYEAFKISYETGLNNQTEEIKKLIKSTSPSLKQKNKSSVIHYRREFPNDVYLNLWAKIMEEESNECFE